MNRRLLTLLIFLLTTLPILALPQPIGRDRRHTVAENDTIFTISRQYGLAPDHVLWANGLTLEQPLRPGQELLIPLRRIPPFTPAESTAIVLNLPERMLYLFRGGRVAAYWGVAIGGAQYPTPSGNFRILAMEKNPTWEPPRWLEQKPIGPGPDNPLGDRWMQITPDMVGIHGTNNPDSIGGVASLGCVRLYPEAVRSLYDQVSVGTPVYITYEQVRVGKEPDGTLIWAFFPDPYAKYYVTAQARDGIAQAQREGSDVEISDFEIKERATNPDGVLSPVFGTPVKVQSNLDLGPLPALRKPTGTWLDAAVLEKMGFTVETEKERTVITAVDGRLASITPQKIPLNPHRLPSLEAGEELKLEGHRWKGKIWLPFPLVLDYFQVPYQWDDDRSVLTLN